MSENGKPRAFKVSAMCRSGHHAIMSWIKAGCDGIEYNNISGRGLSHNDKSGEYAKKIIDTGKNIVFNFEDWPLENTKGASHPFQDYDITSVVVVRDPLNWLASRLALSKKPHLKWMANWDVCCPIMVNYLRQAAGRADFIGPCVVIKYDNWFADEEYRKGIAEKLDIEDRGIGAGLGYMRLSSFQAAKTDPKNANVNERWRKFVDNEEFRDILKGRYTFYSLGRDIFGGEGYDEFKP